MSAPILVLLYDSIFIERKWSRLWSKRRFYYYGLLSSWSLVAFLNHATKTRSGVYGFTGPITLGEHLQTQSWALIHYLKLIFWPDSLVLDYGIVKILESRVYLSCGLAILMMVGGILWLLWRKPAIGLWGLWAIFLLAPTSTIIPMQSEPVAEHRVYLVLASVLFYGVVGGYHFWGRVIFPVLLLIGIGLGTRTYLRNQDYQSTESIWRATVLAAPLNPRAHNNYAGALFSERKWEEAEFHLKETIRLEPRHLNVYLNYGRLYQVRGEFIEAEGMYRRAIELYPHFSEAKRSWSELLIHQGRIEEAEKLYREVLQEEPMNPLAYLNLGVIYESRGEWLEAEKIYLQAFENEVPEPLITERLSKIQEKLLP